MTIETIVFDFGNVVGFFDHRLTTNRLAGKADISADQVHAKLFGGALEIEYDLGRLTTAAFIDRAREACGLHCTDAEFAAAWADIFWHNRAVIDLLPILARRYQLLLASNTNELHSRQFRRQFVEPFQHFAGLVLSHEIGQRKPDAAFFEHCQRLANCAADACLFIDDLAVNVAGARACGWHGVLYARDMDLPAELRRHGVTL